MKKLLLTILLMLFSISIVSAQYYADVQIFVEDNGLVNVEGKSNYQSLLEIKQSDIHTSKKNGIWTLNITIDENFDNFVYELNLPKYSTISYLKTTPTFRITDNGDHLQLIGTGENQKFYILLQYKIDTTKAFVTDNMSTVNYIFYSIGVLIIIIGTLVILKLIRMNNKKKKVTLNEEKIKVAYSILPQRQQDIIKLLKKNDKMTQKQLEEIMEIPKSSISRNVQTLVVKGIVRKEQVGQTNYLSLK